MENNITDLFADSINDALGENKKESVKEKGKSSSFKSSAMVEAMALLSNPKKLKGIIGALIILLIIGLGSVIAFFVIYPVCIIWAIVSYMFIALAGRTLKFIKDVNSKRDY